MEYDFEKMHNQNAKDCSDCQLVTVVNAHTYFTGNRIEQEDEFYQEMVDLVCARNGAAISIEKAHEALGIKIKKEYRWFHQWEEAGRLMPAELKIWHKKTGFHSTCLVDYESKSGAYRLMGFRHETTHDCWVFGENLYQWIKNCGQNTPEVRVFELQGD